MCTELLDPVAFALSHKVGGDGVPLAWRDFEITCRPAGHSPAQLAPRRAAVAGYFCHEKTWMKGDQTLNVNPGSRSDEAELAWVLAQAAQPYLDAVQRHDIYMAIGVGETFSAISSLITAVVVKHVTLGADLVNRLVIWLDAYVGNDREPHLRRLIGQVMVTD